MGDVTLTDEDIAKIGTALLAPFENGCLKGASYDIRVGSRVFVAEPEEIRAIALDGEEGGGTVNIPPGRAFVIQSLEKVFMPLAMKGSLHLRSFWATKLLSFTGGFIDPGYKGYLFFPLVNISDSPISLKYGDPLISAEFIRLSKPASRPYSDEEISTLRTDRRPAKPAKKPLNPVEMTLRIENLDKKTASYEPLIESSKRIMDSFLMASVAGVLAGAIVVLFEFLPKTNPYVFGAAIAVAVFLTIYLIHLLRRR